VNLANAITLARLAAVPAVAWLILADRWQAGLALFVLASLSDALDGWIARRFGQETALGRYLDPLADKALVATVYVLLGLREHLPLWVVWVIVLRELAVLGGVALVKALRRDAHIAPNLWGKANTALLFCGALLMLAVIALQLHPAFWFVDVLAWTLAVSTVATAAGYFRVYLLPARGERP